jgi:hypothetical protein
MPQTPERLKALWFSGTRRFQALPVRVRVICAFRVMAQASVLFDGSDRPVFTLAKEHKIEVALALFEFSATANSRNSCGAMFTDT